MRRWVMYAGNALSLLGFLTFIASALAMAGFWLLAMKSWLGWVGFVIAVLTAPVGVVMPFIAWGVDGVFSPLYFGVWGIGLLGMVFSMMWAWFLPDKER